MQKTVSALASVANNADQVNLLILGAGRGGLAMLKALQYYDWITIHSIVDIHQHAIAFPLASSLGIRTSIDRKQALQAFDGDIVIDVTGDQTMGDAIATDLATRQIELIAGKSAKLVFDLVAKQLKHKKTIHSQNARLDLLDSMLEITTQLENHPPLADIMHTSLLSLERPLHTSYGLVMVFNDDASGSIVHTNGEAKPDCDEHIISATQNICHELKQHHRFKLLKQPIGDDRISYNLILPLWHQDQIIAALLMHVPDELDREQRTSLNMSSIHLNTAAKTLQQYKHLEHMAINDALTGMYNRRYFDQQLQHEISRIQRNKFSTLSCAFIDIDDFKHVNDNYGHPMGDIVLKEIANSIARSIRDYDVCARYGGDEFIVLLPSDSLNGQHIEQVGLRILKHIAEISLTDAPELNITVSIGMATQSAETLDAKTLLKLADLAVYQAKKAGKNCLRLHADEQFHYSAEND